MPDAAMRTPSAVWALIVALSLTQPLVHVLCLYFPPAGTVATGLDIPDSALFFHAMGMFPTGFHSAYATCLAAGGEAAIAYYSVPHLWLYGLLGLIAQALPLDPFLVYGLASGIGAAFYLWVVYRLLLTVAPRHALAAFVLFTLSGGPGGLLYLLTGWAGLHEHAAFEEYFHRFAMYDLMEGPHFNPVLYFPRLYYTLSLGGCLGGLGAVIRQLRDENIKQPWGWMIAIAFGSFLDARYAVFTLGVLGLYLLCQPDRGRAPLLRALLTYSVPAGLGFLVAAALMGMNPAVVENHLAVANMAMWFSPFLLVTWLHWLVGTQALWHGARSAPVVARVLLFAGAGYLTAYGVGYLVYQYYYGNLLAGRDGSVAAAVSDWALIGGLSGAFAIYWRPARDAQPEPDATRTWLLLWLVGFTALSLSGFGQGWFLRFGPQRLQVFIWLPLCLVAAMGLAAMPTIKRRVAWCALLFCGVSSVAVAVFAFQSPLGRAYAKGAYALLHAEVMSTVDGELMGQLGQGIVISPAPASDVIVRLKGNAVVFGIGTFNLTDQPYGELKEEVDTFFAANTPDAVRRDIAERWCVAWVYCPATWPVAADTRAQLRAATWLEVAAEKGEGMVLRVKGAAERP